MESKVFTKVLVAVKFLVFISLFITSFLVYRMIGNKGLAAIILSMAIMFSVLAKIDSMDRRIKKLEG